MYCSCSNKCYVNIKQHQKSKRHQKYMYNKHWTEVIFDADVPFEEDYSNYRKLAEKCQEIYLEILLNENIDELTIIK